MAAVKLVPNLSYNFVAFANRGDEEVVLKIGVPNRALVSEIHALKFFNGCGAVRLLDADESRGMFLLERIRPGKMLSTLEDDDQATHTAADVMLKLWRPLKNQKQASGLQNSFIKLTDWFDELKNFAAPVCRIKPAAFDPRRFTSLQYFVFGTCLRCWRHASSIALGRHDAVRLAGH